jgi:hypothetical protein
MSTSGHHAAEAAFGLRTVRVDVNDPLHLGVIEEKTVYRAITPSYKGICETTKI